MTRHLRGPKALTCALLAVLCAATTALGAANGRITGKIVDSSTGEELPGAHVLVVGTSLGTATQLDGTFVIPAVPAGSHVLRVTYIGYLTATVPVEVQPGRTATVEISLDWEGMTGEEVVITAQAQGQIGAINRQLNSITITNMVSADRIRELPDVNAAESIGRLPGVSIQRSGGEANKVAIRGLSPKYNTVTVNGVRVPASGGDDRSVDLSLISSNMLDGIEVMKAITPDKDADAIGGAVDLQLKSAPEGIAGDLQLQGGYNELQNYYGNYRISGSLSSRVFRNKLGAIASFHLDGYDRSADKFDGDYRQSSDPRTGDPLIIISDVNVREETVRRDRTGASLVLDYQLPNGEIKGNSFYNELDSDAFNRINLMDANDNRHYYDIESRVGETSIFTGALAIRQDFNWFQYDAGLSRTASRTDNPMDYTWRFAQEGDAFDQQPGANTHPNVVPDFLNIDTLLTGLQDIYVWTTDREENETATQLNLQVPFRLGDNVNGYFKTGGKLRWLDRFNDEEQAGRNGLYYGSGGGNLSETFECLADVHPEWGLDELIGDVGRLPISFVNSDYSRDDFLRGEYPLGFAPDEKVLKEITHSLISCGPDIWRQYSIGSLQRDYDGEERYKAAYGMVEFRIGPRLTLIPGIRYEDDWSEYNGQRFRETTPNNIQGPPAELEFITNVRENSFWLPMVHLNYKPTSWLQLRLAYTETLTRPDYIQYAPITTINSFRNYVRAANGLLRPTQSTNYDFAVSVYENKVGLFTVAPFYKSLTDLILWVDYNLHPDVGTLEGMNVPDHWVEARPRANTYINNPFESNYQGVELDWQTNFWYLPSLLKGIVLNANYTYIESETTYQAYFIVNSDSLIRQRPPVFYQELRTDSVRVARMPDQPKHIANVTLGYDYRGFSTRLSFLYQTDTSTFINSTNPLFDTFSGDYMRWDLSVRQALSPGLEVYANFNNLNGRPDRNFRASDNGSPSYTEYYGFTSDIGVRYRF